MVQLVLHPASQVSRLRAARVDSGALVSQVKRIARIGGNV
jgi:hypothetical protein